MKRQIGDAVVVLIVLLVVGALASAFWSAWYGCHAKWDRANMVAVEWGPIQGCMIKMPDGRWLPTDRVREFDLPRPQ